MLEVHLSDIQEQQDSLIEAHWADTSYIQTEEDEQEYLRRNPYVGAYVNDGENGEVYYLGKIGRDIQTKVLKPWSLAQILEPKQDAIRLFIKAADQFHFAGYLEFSDVGDSFVILGREEDFRF
jgi:hypothetical protein